jgi:hypothetical protein
MRGTPPRPVADPWPDASSPEWLPLRLPWRASPPSPSPSLRSLSPAPNDDDALERQLQAWERAATPHDADDASDADDVSRDAEDGPVVRVWLCGDAVPAPKAQKRSAKGSAAASFDSDDDEGARKEARAEAAVPSKAAAIDAGASTATSPAPTLV